MITGARGLGASLALTASLLGLGCGKKGPPMAPIVRVPAAVDKIAAARLGDDVYVTLTVPATNIDTSVPVDIGRIEVYGYTGRTAPTLVRWTGLATLVASIPVAPPPPVTDAPLQPPGVLASASGALPGTPVTVLDVLTPDEFEQGQVFVDPRLPELKLAPALALPNVMRRFYLAVPFSSRGRPGVPGAQAELVLTALPDPPSDVRASYTASATLLSWEPSGGLFGFLLDRSLPPEPTPFVATPPPATAVAAPPVLDASLPPGPTMYTVYRDVAPDPLELPLAAIAAPWNVPVPTSMTPSPLAGTSTTDAVALGRARCYVVRAQRGAVLSAPSPRTCIAPVDIFPPAAPIGVAAVPSEGGISLIWEPGSELDLGGYLVLRGEPGDATLRQLTDRPIADARYRDATVQPGQRYLYAVVAVDSQMPLPNVSAESEQVEETAR